jgi:hypothetical protein
MSRVRQTWIGLALLLALGCALTAGAGLPSLNKAGKGVLNKATGAPAGGAATDPKAWLDRADDVVRQVQGATECLDKSRAALFSLAATAEEKRLLESMREEAGAAPEEVAVRTRQYQADVVEKAKAEKRYEAKRLSAEQAANLGRVGGNLLLAAAHDRQALDSGRRLIDNADEALAAAREPKQALRLGKDAGRLVAMPAQLGRAVGEVPGQLTALGALLEAVNQTRRNNPVELREAPASGGAYEAVDDF